MAISITKADGSREIFQKEKIVTTCLHMGATKELAESIAEKIEDKVYDGISSSKILQMIFRESGRYMPAVRHHIDLRRALSLIRPKPDFEQFIQILLKEQGYELTSNLILRGKCVEHEIDTVARKNGKTYIVEVKHHYDHHTLTGLDVPRIARAIFEDVADGFKLGLNSVNADQALVISNTKFSDHARRYSECRQIECIGWNTPPGQGLDRMILDKQLYPLTYLKNLDSLFVERIMAEGILLLKQLINCNPEELSRKTKISRARIKSSIEKARIVSSART